MIQRIIRNIWAVGRNYQAHANEMGQPVPSTPMIFLKAGSAATMSPEVRLYQGSKDIHHEVEIVLRFGTKADSNGRLEFDAAAIGLDLTARDLQAELKAKSHPWTLAKSFRDSLPVSAMVAIPPAVPHFKFELSVNGETRQRGDTRDMIFDFETLRTYVFDNFPVEPGDLLLTGTPEGVARLKTDDRAEASFESGLGHRVRAEWIFR